ncbi:MAG TPA: hypothetical protein VGR73_12840 [Bryobacteraceae bacterium]|nr:hypothetical protein [Bryobacteraceae bacterium]
MKLRLLIVPAFMATALLAQGPGGQGGHREIPGGGPQGTPPDPAKIVQHNVKMLTVFFDLDTAQVATATAALTTEQTCLTGGAAALKTARMSLTDAIKANAGISGAVANLSAVEQAATLCRADAAAAIYAVLSMTQQAKLTNGLGPLMGGPGGFRGRF